MPCAESVRVPSRSKITSCGRVAATVSSRVVTHPLSPTAHYCRDVASRIRAAARYHGDQAAGPGHAGLRRQRSGRSAARLAGRAAGGAAGGPRPLPERRRRAAGKRRRGGQARPQPRRGGAAGRGGRGLRTAGQPGPTAGGADRAVVHRARGGADGRRGSAAARRAALRRTTWPTPTYPRTPISSSSATRPIRPRCCIAAIRSWRCAGRVASWWSTRRSPTPFPASCESLAGDALPDVVVLRSLTKTWALAGLRVGYALGAPGRAGAVDGAARPLAAGHPATGGDRGLLHAGGRCRGRCGRAAAGGAARRDGGGLDRGGREVVDGCAPFVLFSVPDAELMRKRLDAKGIAVRRCDTFVGLDGQFLRAPRCASRLAGCWSRRSR